MANHATANDLFNAFTQGAKQVVGFAARQKDKLAEMYYQNEVMKLNHDTTQFLQKLEEDGDYDNYLNKYGEFKKKYVSDLEKRDEAHASIRKSAYFRKIMGRALIENNNYMEAQVRGRQIKAQRETGRALFVRNVNQARELYADDPQGLIDSVHGFVRTAVTGGYISYAESLQVKDDVFRKALEGDIERQVWDSWLKGKTIDDLDEIFAGIDLSKYEDRTFSPVRNESDRQYAEFLRAKIQISDPLKENEAAWLRAYEGDQEESAEEIKYAQELAKKENLTDTEEAWLAGYKAKSLKGNETEGYEEKLVIDQRRLEAIKKSKTDWARQTWNTFVTGKRKETDGRISVTYGNVLTAVTRGDPNAAEMIRAGLNEVASYNNVNIDPDDRNKYNKWYNDLYEAVMKGSKEAGKKAVEAMIENMMPSFIQAGLEGYFDNMYDAKDAYKQAVYTELVNNYGYAGKIGDIERDFPIIGNFFNESIKAMKERGPEFAGVIYALNEIDNYVKEGFKDPKSRFNELYREQKIETIAAAMERAYDVMFSNKIPKINGPKLVEETKNFINTLVAADLDILRINPETGESNFVRSKFDTEDETLAKTVYALGRPDAVWTDTRGQRRFNGIDQGIAEEVIYKALPARLINELRKKDENISVGDILPPQFTRTEGGRDEDGIIEYRLKNDPNTKYRFTASKDGEKYTWALEKSVASGRWTPVTSPQAQKQEAQEALKSQRAAEERMNFLVSVSSSPENINPPGDIMPAAWQRMSSAQKQQRIQNLKADDPQAYEEWEERVFSNPPSMVRGMAGWETMSRDRRESVWNGALSSGRR